MTAAAFRRLLTDPRTGPRLDAMLADCAHVDAQLATAANRPGPRACCGEYARVSACDGVTDIWLCPVCERSWAAVCQ